MASQREFERMSAEELGQWMVDKGFSEEVRAAFINEGMDGEAVCLAFATTTGPDCLRDVIKQYGIRLKVYRTIKDVLAASEQDVTGGSEASQTDSTIILSENDAESDAEPTVKEKRQLLLFTPSVIDDGSSSSSNSPRPTIRKGSNKVPNPFPIPTFRKETEINFKNKRLDDDDRKYVVRTLATMLCTYVQSPSTKDCEIVAKSLVAVHPFLKQAQSWKTYIYTKAQNINRPSTRKESVKPAKRAKYFDLSKHPYPSLTLSCDDDTAHERHIKLLKQENGKLKPNMESVKELMIRTFPRRRKWILDEEHLVVDICQEYPFLRKQTIVASEMDMILGTGENSRDLFTSNWQKWEPAILKYASFSKNKPAALKHALRDMDGSPEEVTLTAFRCVVYLFTTKNRNTKGQGQKGDEMDIPYVLNEKTRGQVIEECCVENEPQIIRYMDADDEIPAQYVVAVEKQAFLQCSNLLSAVYALFSVHYIFNIEYHPRVKDFYLFMQNKCFIIDDKLTSSASYSNIVTSLECYLDS